MKKNLILLFILFCISTTAYAGTEYLVARAGTMLVNVGNTTPLISSGVYYGYNLNEKTSIEAEANVGLSGGKYNDGKGNFGSFDIWTVAAYAAYRHPLTHNLYAKGKFGLLFENITNNTRSEKLIHQDYGFSGGLGLGLQLKQKLTLETELSLLERDIYYAGLGVHYKF